VILAGREGYHKSLLEKNIDSLKLGHKDPGYADERCK
jgi:hypothetical protein